jgi:hypothetical protein
MRTHMENTRLRGLVYSVNPELLSLLDFGCVLTLSRSLSLSRALSLCASANVCICACTGPRLLCQRYATSATTGFVVRELSRKASILPPQEFVVRNDCPCGSTIGPAIAALTGIRTVDVGISCWSMHSIRETIGVDDVESSIKLFTTFYKSFRESSGECVHQSRCACMCETRAPSLPARERA